MRILIVDPQFDDTPDIEREVAGPEATLVVWRTQAMGPVPDAELALCDALVNCRSRHLVTAPLIARLERCRIVSQAGVGFNHIDLEACAARGIPVCNTPDYGTSEVADHALGLALALSRGIVAYDRKLRTRAIPWDARVQPQVRRIKGLTFGVVGLGRIGLAAALRARGFELVVDFYDPYLPPGFERALGFRRATSLAELLGRVDIVSLHTPLTAETEGLIDDAALAAARPGLVLVNTSRGRVCDLDAIERALRDGRLMAAGLDVLPDEPLDYDHPLIAAWAADEPWLDGRMIVTPHAAFFSEAGVREMRAMAVRNVTDYLRDGRLRSCVNRHLLAPRPAP